MSERITSVQNISARLGGSVSRSTEITYRLLVNIPLLRPPFNVAFAGCFLHECDLNIEWGEGANVIMCYNICDRD